MYGISYSKKIPLIGITCFDLFQFVIPKSNIKKTLMFICSSNDQKFIRIYSNQDDKYLIKKIDYKLQSIDIDYANIIIVFLIINYLRILLKN